MSKQSILSGLIFYFVTLSNLSAQDWTWWANNVHYDGKTSWTDYLIFSPKYMGPNALPVPNFSDGLVNNNNAIRISGSAHLSDGDNTFNPNIYINLNLLRDILSFDLHYLPIEYFDMSHQVKTERKTFYYFYDRNKAHGDTYLNTNIQLIKRNTINLKLRIGYKFPTSNMIGLARFTDKPGYYFDLNFGKKYDISSNLVLSLNGMAGFYVWETNSDFQYQNDAPLYGLGVSLKKGNSYNLETGWRGYYGYLNNGDKPLVWKTSITKTIKNVELNFSYQLGLHDTKYHSYEFGVGYIFSRIHFFNNNKENNESNTN